MWRQSSCFWIECNTDPLWLEGGIFIVTFISKESLSVMFSRFFFFAEAMADVLAIEKAIFYSWPRSSLVGN